MIFFIIIGTISIIGNLFVLIVIFKSKNLRHSQYVYNCSIAISDVIWGLTVNMYYVCQVLNFLSSKLICSQEVFSDTVSNVTRNKDNITKYVLELEKVNLSQDIFNFFENFNFKQTFFIIILLVTPITLLISFITLVVAAIDRYIALTFPFKYKQINTVKRSIIVSLFVWVLTSVFYICSTYESGHPSLFFQPFVAYNYFNKNGLNQSFTVAVLFSLFVMLWTLTVMTVFSLRKSYKRSLALNRITKKGYALEKKLSLVFIFMVLSFTFSLTPTIYNHIYYYALENSGYVPYEDKQFFLCILFLSTNSTWNFLIYNILNKNFRNALKTCVGLKNS